LDASAQEDHFIREAISLAKSAGIIELIYSDSPFVIEHLRLGQVRQFLPADTLAAVGHRQFLTRDLQQRVVSAFAAELEKFAYVMTCDMLRLHFAKMVRELGLPAACAALPRENVSGPESPALRADVRRALMDVNGAGFTCYDHVRRREAAMLADWALARFEADVNVGETISV
jgi:hypothetical protein